MKVPVEQPVSEGCAVRGVNSWLDRFQGSYNGPVDPYKSVTDKNPNPESYDRFAESYELIYGQIDEYGVVRAWLDLAEATGLVPSRAERERQPPSLIDVGCGPGWYLPAWASHYFRVAGLDCSPRMLEMARQNLRAARITDSGRLYQADIREVAAVRRLGRKFDLAVSHFSFPNLFPPNELPALFGGIAELLAPGGLWLTDLRPELETADETVERIELPEGKIVRRSDFDCASGSYRQFWTVNDLDFQERFWFHNSATVARARQSSNLDLIADSEWPAPHDSHRDDPNPTPRMLILHASERKIETTPKRLRAGR